MSENKAGHDWLEMTEQYHSCPSDQFFVQNQADLDEKEYAWTKEIRRSNDGAETEVLLSANKDSDPQRS